VPLASVSAFAWPAHNPFNGALFALLSAALIAEAAAARDGRRASGGARWSRHLGLARIAFGWVYPHFLLDRQVAMYLFAAPLGLIPCPTLSAVIGIALCVDGLRN
jgi:hypothetical protein